MVKSDVVNNDNKCISEVLSNYQNQIDNLSGSWKETSYDSFSSKADVL